MIFNEKIHRRFTGEEDRLKKEASLRDLKREALEFVSYGTLAPSQISRWNNVCETYRSLQKQNGVNDALEEISQKITLLNEEQVELMVSAITVSMIHNVILDLYPLLQLHCRH